MIPSTFVPVESFSLTPNGKLDRDALPKPEAAQHEVEIVEPRNDTERELVRIWHGVLEIDDPIGVTDDFFALGGHSLLAVRVFAEIERTFGIKLPLGLLFQGATVENLASALAEKERRDRGWDTIVPIRAEGTKPPLFVIAGSDGEFLHYREFLDRLDADQPIYGLQPNLTNRSDPPTTIAGIAEMYVRDLLEFMPEGDIMIAGYCFSGLVAFEAARQLEQLGRHPTLLAVIDSYYARSKARHEVEKQKFADFLRRDLRGKVGLDRAARQGALVQDPHARPVGRRGRAQDLRRDRGRDHDREERDAPRTALVRPRSGSCPCAPLPLRGGGSRLDPAARVLARARRGRPRGARARSARHQARQHLEGPLRERPRAGRRRGDRGDPQGRSRALVRKD